MSGSARTRGFSMIEAVMVLLIVSIVVGALTPSVIRQITNARVNRAASVIAADLMQAQTLAGRQQSPVRAVVDAVAKTITITQPGGSTISVRHFGSASEYKLYTLTSTVTSIMILPNGTTSATATITATGSSGHAQQVRISRAGLVRIL